MTDTLGTAIGCAIVALCLVPRALRLKRERDEARFRDGIMEECGRTPMLPALDGLLRPSPECSAALSAFVAQATPDPARSAEIMAGGDGKWDVSECHHGRPLGSTCAPCMIETGEAIARQDGFDAHMRQQVASLRGRYEHGPSCACTSCEGPAVQA